MASPWPKSSRDRNPRWSGISRPGKNMIRLLSSQIYISLFRTERTKPPLGNPNPIRRHIPIFHQNTFAASFGRVVTTDWVSPRPCVGLTTHRNCHVDKIHISLILEIKNQTRQILEIKSVIWEIKRDKFRKSKVPFDKSKATNFWKSKVPFHKSNATNFGNQKCHLRNQTTSFWKSNMYWKNQTRKMQLRNQRRQVLEIKY